MADLVSGRYGQANPLWAVLGQLTNQVDPSVPARSNAEYLGYSTLTDGALAGSGIMCAVPIPVDQGTVITAVTMLVGATAASTPTHSFAALYSGTAVAAPPLMAQSADTTTAAIAASAAFTFTLATPQTITGTNCPNGFVYAVVSVTGTAVNSAASVSTPTAVGYQWLTATSTPKGASPLGLSLTSGSGVGGTATATLASPSAKAVAPILILT